jgi:folate-binding Fe-S cluster repair protein YgfZ
VCICASGDEQQLLLDVDASGVSSALQWLNRYKLRRQLVMEDVSSRAAVWAAFDGQLNAGTSGEAGREGGEIENFATPSAMQLGAVT